MLRAWLARRRMRRLPAISVSTTADFYKPFTAPNPDMIAVIRNAAGEQVATAAYAVSPLSDRLYVFEVEVAAEHRRRGYASALLWHLAESYALPITPVEERSDAGAFWNAARRLD